MNSQDTRGKRDPQLGELLERAVGLPEPDATLKESLERALSIVDHERSDVRCRDAGRAARFRRPALLATVGLAALVALVVVNLIGLPGVKQATPPANAAKLVAMIDAGLTRVDSLQGVFVFDSPPSSGWEIASVDFAATSNGDKAFDVHYLPDYKKLRKGWLSAKKSQAPESVKRGEMMQFAAKVRQRAVVDGATGFMQSKTWSVDPATRELVGVRYRYYRGIVMFGARPLVGPRDVQQIWLLSSQLRAALAQQQPSVELNDVSYQGRSAYRAVVYGTDGKPAYVAFVDKQYGVTLRLSAVPGPHRSDELGLTPFHLKDLRVNEPVDPATFVMKPDYRYAPDGYGKRQTTDIPKKYGIDLGERTFPVSDVPKYTSSWTLLPTWVPKGYSLQQAAAQSWPDFSWMWLTYRQGMSEIQLATAARTATGPRGEKRFASNGFVFGAIGDGLNVWPAIGSGVSVMPAGAMAGWPAGHGEFFHPGLSTVGTATFAIWGNVPIDTLERMAESVRQVKTGPYLPEDRHSWQPWLLLAVAAALAAATLLLVIRRRRRLAELGIRLPLWKSIRLPLVGLALVVAGTSLSWHRMYGAGNDFSMLGWREPLAVATVTVALLALAAATWALAVPMRPPISPRFLTSLLGLLVLVGTALGFVYLPLKARFVVEPFGYDLAWKGLSTVGTYLRGEACPAPGPGLYLALIGACLIVLGGLCLRVGDLSPSQRRRALFIRLAVLVPVTGGLVWFGLAELSRGRTILVIVSLAIACLLVLVLTRIVGSLARVQPSPW